jgi:membrane-associated phospholipid phosphatase
MGTGSTLDAPRRAARTARPADDPPGRAAPVRARIPGPLPRHRPAAAAALVALYGYVALVVVMVLVGLLVTRFGRARWDAIGVNRWFVEGRTAPLDDLSDVGSHLAATLTVVLIAVVVVAVLAFRRRFADADLIGIGLPVEVAVFLTTTLLVERGRPDVVRLDSSPPTSSFPSGHTAAAIVLYGGLAVILYRTLRRRLLRFVVTASLVAVPVAVGIARLYRGMHHPTDVLAGVVLGFGALAVATLSVRVAATTAARRERDLVDDEQPTPGDADPDAVGEVIG